MGCYPWQLIILWTACTLQKAVARAFYMVWQFFEPLLFGLIGAAVDINFISPALIGKGCLYCDESDVEGIPY